MALFSSWGAFLVLLGYNTDTICLALSYQFVPILPYQLLLVWNVVTVNRIKFHLIRIKAFTNTWVPEFRCLFVAFLLLRHQGIHQRKIGGMLAYDEQPWFKAALVSRLSIYWYPSQSFAVRSQLLIFSFPICNIDCRNVKNQYSYCFETNVFLTCGIIIFLMSIWYQ